MFVDPIPRSFEGLMSWEQFMERVDVLSSEELEVRVADLLERQSAAYPSFARALRRQLEVGAPDDLRHEVIRITLRLNELTSHSMERELARRPLLIETASAKRWLKVRPCSLARQREVGQAVINVFTANQPSERMTRAAFIAAVRDQLPRLSRDAIIRLWRELAPEDWKLPGRKSRP